MAADPTTVACVALRDFVHRSAALRAQALVPRGDGEPPALVSCLRLGPLEVTIGERTVHLAHDEPLDAAPPDLGELRAMPPFEVSPERGEVAGMIGGMDLLGEAVMTLAEAIGPQAAVVVEMESTTPGTPLVVSARPGEPLLVTLGEEEFEV